MLPNDRVDTTIHVSPHAHVLRVWTRSFNSSLTSEGHTQKFRGEGCTPDIRVKLSEEMNHTNSTYFREITRVHETLYHDTFLETHVDARMKYAHMCMRKQYLLPSEYVP